MQINGTVGATAVHAGRPVITWIQISEAVNTVPVKQRSKTIRRSTTDWHGQYSPWNEQGSRFHEHHRSTTWHQLHASVVHGCLSRLLILELTTYFVIMTLAIVVEMRRVNGLVQRFHSTSDSRLSSTAISVLVKVTDNFQIYPHELVTVYKKNPLENIIQRNSTGHDAFPLGLFDSSV